MRIILFVFLFFSICSSAQNTELEMKIDSITSIDSSPKKRKFTIHYHIENRTNTVVSFILNTHAVRSNATNSTSWIPSYRLHQENEIIIADNIFNSTNTEDVIQKLKGKLETNKGNLETYFTQKEKKLKEQTSKNIIKSLIKLNPDESKTYTITLDWDKNRYIQYFDNEYYLDGKTTHYIDLFVNLYKEELYERLLPEDLNTIKEDKTITKGWIQSNKMEINFKE
ncbi:hypothetical protein SAMN05443667_10922 [Flavobacterium gillisiae]|uniref:Uncharacterized protein n=2 Tax=Flavobacterium gillisiae TaxID=150146 RepID=A0A1H4E666_9FLAO|nr:hypothetical protein SAMN05443667_10922 [Flavobacterium gillisiae]